MHGNARSRSFSYNGNVNFVLTSTRPYTNIETSAQNASLPDKNENNFLGGAQLPPQPPLH